MATPYAGPDIYPVDMLIPDDGDDEAVTSVNVPLQALAKRTTYLFNRTGAPSVANFAALTAIAAPSNGWIRFVANFGLYYFDSASVLAAASPYVFVPDDATPGRWLSQHMGLRDQNNGLAGLDASGRVNILGATPTDWPRFKVAPRGKSRAISLQNAWTTFWNQTRDYQQDFYPGLCTSPDANEAPVSFLDGSIRIRRQGGSVDTTGLMLALDDYLHDGATLTGVSVYVAGASGRATLPSQPFSVGVFRKSADTAGQERLLSTGDFVDDPTATVGAYELPHHFNYIPDQNNVIDRAVYSYFLQFWNEWGTGGPTQPDNLVLGVVLTMANIVDMRFP